jgi:hypothetical protein
MGINASFAGSQNGSGRVTYRAPVDESEVIFTPMQAHSLVLLMIDCSFSHLMALRTASGLQAPDSRDGIFPHADTTQLCREWEMLKIRAAALSTLLVMRLDWLSSYGCCDCTGLLGATSGSTSAKRPQNRSAGHDEQGAAAVAAAVESHIDGA